MKIGYVLAILSRLWSIYVSKQFFKYLVCGGLSSLVHVIARLILSNYMEYGWAVFTSYFIGMPVALGAGLTARITGREPFVTRDGVRMSRKKMYFTSDKASRELGYAPRPARQAIADAVAWFRTNGYLR